ncbi:sulfatase [Flammeovirga sp. SubArs3]|uniref:sulfatase n=1 Tax=Flammeovirga sp. SubArs3 TaxID=2995316 RepID=UPI00248BFF80|nr:sulfatase [Flammeovirga sp. SubArs3]
MKKVLFILLLGLTQVGYSQKQYNVIQIIVDDLGWKDLSSYGSDYYETPALDKFAEKSIVYTNSYASCNVCSPTRASIVTGKYPAKLNLTDWIEGWKMPYAKYSVPEWTMYLETSQQTVGKLFKENGYKTAHFGKWHLGEDEGYWPENHGFDENHGGWSKGAPHKNKKKGYNGYFMPYGNPRLKDGPQDEYLTERLAKDVCLYIEENKNEKFFVNLWFYNVHTPLQARAEKVDKYKNKEKGKYHSNPTYAAMIEHVDEAIGQVLNKVEDLGLMENTIILFSSDNGGLIGKPKRKVTNNLPLKGGKGTIYEGGIRVPTMIYAPNLTPNKVDYAVSSIDYLPTLAQLAHLKIEKDVQEQWDGISIVEFNQTEHYYSRPLYWHYPHYHSQGAVPHTVVIQEDWKLIHNIENGNYELYNLRDDIGEQNNLVKSEKAKFSELKKKMKVWKKEVGAQMPTKNPNYKPTSK